MHCDHVPCADVNGPYSAAAFSTLTALEEEMISQICYSPVAVCYISLYLLNQKRGSLVPVLLAKWGAYFV